MALDPGTIKTWVDIVSGIVTILAILVGGAWFLLRRSLAGTLETTLTLRAISITQDATIAVTHVHIKNIGQTRIKRKSCIISSQQIMDLKETAPFTPIRTDKIDYIKGLQIFRDLAALEPNEELSEDVALCVERDSLFQVGVQFVRAKTFFWQTEYEDWIRTAVFSTSATEGVK